MECAECKTEYGYIRMDSQEWVCRKCGQITPTNTQSKEKNEDNQKGL